MALPHPNPAVRARTAWAALAAATALCASGCSTTVRAPDLGAIYQRAARTHGPDRNPVVVIPGLLGSKLVDGETGRLVWGAWSGSYANPTSPAGARLVALPMEAGRPLSELADDVHPDGALDRLRVSILGVPIVLRAYAYILAALGVGGFRDEALGRSGAIDYGTDHYTCFQFDYDWRRDIPENARRFHAFLLEKRAYVARENRDRYGHEGPPPRFDVVAHSMGGLLLRYYLRYGVADLPADDSAPEVTWAGADLVERAILVGPPNSGAVEALRELVHGTKPALFLPRYRAAILGTMPSVYQLLPRARHGAVQEEQRGRTIDPLDPARWVEHGWGLADPGEDAVLADLLPEVATVAERRAIALDHLHKCLERARAFTRALDAPARRPAGLDLYLIAGDAQPTPAEVVVAAGDGDVRITDRAAGDGVVLRSSALGDERVGAETWSPTLDSAIDWTQVIFLSTDHLGLTQDPAFTDNVLYLLLEDPRR